MSTPEQIRIRIMSEAYDLADRGDSEGYNAVKVMCSDVLALIEALGEHEYVLDCPRCGHCGQKREWVGLTDADIKEGADLSRLYQDQFEPVARWAESKIKEKNHGAI
jgi:hypothetical protein